MRETSPRGDGSHERESVALGVRHFAEIDVDLLGRIREAKHFVDAPVNTESTAPFETSLT